MNSRDLLNALLISKRFLFLRKEQESEVYYLFIFADFEIMKKIATYTVCIGLNMNIHFKKKDICHLKNMWLKSLRTYNFAS